jgi:lipoate-protein ligase A
MAYELDPDLVPRLIRIGRARVSPRGVRSAEKKVSPLRRWVGLGRDEVVQALAACFLESHPARFGSISAEELAAAHALAAAKYAKPEWVDRLH